MVASPISSARSLDGLVPPKRSGHASTAAARVCVASLGAMPARLDHVYVSASVEVVRVELGFARGSDHQPVVADVVPRTD